jgi:hypothetical protein
MRSKTGVVAVGVVALVVGAGAGLAHRMAEPAQPRSPPTRPRDRPPSDEIERLKDWSPTNRM